MEKVLNMRFIENQGAEDIYQNVETKRFYARQPIGNEPRVRWCTASKWSGGYEPDTPLRAGITIRAIDKHGHALFEEKQEADARSETPSAKKVGVFSYETLIGLRHAWSEKLHLRPYEEWQDFVLRDMAACRYQGYAANWPHCETEVRDAFVMQRTSILGEPVHVLGEQCVHKISGKTWLSVGVYTPDHQICLQNCGYVWEASQDKPVS